LYKDQASAKETLGTVTTSANSKHVRIYSSNVIVQLEERILAMETVDFLLTQRKLGTGEIKEGLT
jgi:hypothetical protein